LLQKTLGTHLLASTR